MLYRSICIAGLLCLMMGCAQSMEDLGGKPSPNLSNGDNDFFKMITISNMTEIQSSQLALSQSQSDAVKAFAQHMIDDHTAAEQKVSAVAEQKGVTLPVKLDSDHQSMVDNLRNKSGSDFDQAYIKLQVQAHKDTISADQDEVNNGSDPDVKALASALLPTLEHHLQMAESLQNSQ